MYNMGNSSSNEEKTLVLDIRTAEEYCTGHICGAINIPTPIPKHGKLREEQVKDLLNLLYTTLKERGAATDTHIVLYCKKGIRSGVATDLLVRDLRMTNVEDMGGIEDEPMSSLLEKHFCQCYKFH